MQHANLQGTFRMLAVLHVSDYFLLHQSYRMPSVCLPGVCVCVCVCVHVCVCVNECKGRPGEIHIYTPHSTSWKTLYALQFNKHRTVTIICWNPCRYVLNKVYNVQHCSQKNVPHTTLTTATQLSMQCNFTYTKITLPAFIPCGVTSFFL